MASLSGGAGVCLVAIFMVLQLSSAVTATDHIVGDDAGWTVNFDYSEWAKDKVFVVGDNLVFKYDNTKHNVYKVNGTDFQSCTIAEGSQALSSGNDVIALGTPGKKWYICGVGDHCRELGMKLVINVMPSSSSAAPSPSPSASPMPPSHFSFTRY